MKNTRNITTKIYTVSTYDKHIANNDKYVLNSDTYRNKFGSVEVWQGDIGYTDYRYIVQLTIQVKNKLHVRRFDSNKSLNSRQLSIYAGKFQKEVFNILEITESF